MVVYDAPTSKVLHRPTGHTNTVSSVGALPKEYAFIICSLDASARFWVSKNTN